MRQGVGCVGRLGPGSLPRATRLMAGRCTTLAALLRPLRDTAALSPSGDTTQEDHGHPVLDRDKATHNATPRRWFAWLK